MADGKKAQLESFFSSLGLLVLRVGAGAAMASAHGWAKLTGYTSETAQTFGDPIGLGSSTSYILAMLAESVCAAAVAVGLLTRLAAIPPLVTMAVAFFVVHGADPFAKKELALLYLIAFATLVFTGPGRFSLDAVLLRRRKKSGG